MIWHLSTLIRVGFFDLISMAEGGDFSYTRLTFIQQNLAQLLSSNLVAVPNYLIVTISSRNLKTSCMDLAKLFFSLCTRFFK